ncbi:MAG: pilus assembly protein PilZ [Spirochaetaceae bacterium]|jgi:hypothetical protein|nr:pilus assembly protein PilZ [Spirochaetaceae bacterium]
MAVITSQKIATYYERYKAIEVTYTKDIIHVTGMVPQQIHLKCAGDFWPCVVYSSSFEGAKVVANIKSGLLNKLQAANNSASLRFCFTNPETNQPVTFFVAVRVSASSPYKDSKDMALFALQFTQRPPDDLIQIMGRLLDANVNSVKRKNERIALTNETIRRLKILPKDISAYVQGVPRPCILREISFVGAKLVIMGVAKFLIEKESALRIDFEDPRESFLIKGKLSAADPVEGRQDLLAVDIAFTEQIIPLGYKIRLNDYLSQVWADSRSADKQNTQGAVKKIQKPSNQNTAETPQAVKKDAAETGAKPAANPTTETAATPGAKPGEEAPGNGKEEKPGPVEKTLGGAARK